MRTTTRLCLVLAVVATAGLVAIPATANAKAKNSVSKKALNKKLKRAHNRISTLRDWNFGLAEKNNAQDEDQAGLQGTVNAILGGVPAIVGGLQALEAALKNEVGPGLLALQAALEDEVGPALVAIDDALQDETTGLVGLNLARPQFGVFGPTGAHLGSTGAAGGSGPNGNAANGTGIGAASTYVVNFRGNVASRVYSVNTFPGGNPASPALAGSAVNCSLAAATCNAILADSGNTSHVLVKIGSGAEAVDGSAFGGFSVTAISG